jgi:hypothetical protein
MDFQPPAPIALPLYTSGAEVDVTMRDTRKIGRIFPCRVVVRIGADKPIADVIAEMHRFCHVLEWPCRMQTEKAWDPVIWCFENLLHARKFQRELLTITEE